MRILITETQLKTLINEEEFLFKNLDDEEKKFIKNEQIEHLDESVLELPQIPNTKNYWHGGNLDVYDENKSQKTGRYQYGPGLYCITHYDTAKKYAKGSRKLYLISIYNGNDITDMSLDYDKIIDFVNKYVISSKRKNIIYYLERHLEDNKVPASVFNNIILNNSAIKPIHTKYLRSFLINNNIDYEIVDNPFGWGETMIVLYNMNKIANIIRVNPKDKIEQFNL